MKKYETPRKSHCTVCGKRLSEKTESGDIRWQIGHVDDSGIYCEDCYPPKKGGKGKKNIRK
jgi:hypothetical protein